MNRQASYWGFVWHRLQQQKQARISLLVIAVLTLLALLAPSFDHLLGQDIHTQNLATRFAQPLTPTLNAGESSHWLGTDELGRDILIRLLYGARISLGVALLATLIAGVIGLIIGSLAGFYGGILDSLLMRATDGLLALPVIPVLIVVAAMDVKKISGLDWLDSEGTHGLAKMIFILSLFSWLNIARLVRSTVLEIKTRDYLLAAKVLGANDWTLLHEHVFPHVIPPLCIALCMGIGEAILFESTLSFLGMGIQPPTPSWGNMLSNSQDIIYQAPLLAIAPGLLILITTMSFNTLADGAKEAMSPKPNHSLLSLFF